jgi:hypothetical protein
MSLYEELQEFERQQKILLSLEAKLPRVNKANGLTVSILELIKDLDRLHNPSASNICYGDGYYAVSLEKKYGQPICELSKIAVEFKRKERVRIRRTKIMKVLEKLDVDELGYVKIEDVKKVIEELIQ